MKPMLCQSLTSKIVLDNRLSLLSQFNLSVTPKTLISLSCHPRPVTIDPPNKEKVRKEFQLFNHNKSPGIGNLLLDHFKEEVKPQSGNWQSCVEKFRKLNVLPTQNKAIVALIFKKTTRNQCNNHQRISLFSISSKLLVSVMLCRLRKMSKRLTCKEQAGFRLGQGCSEHFVTLRQALERCHMY